MNFDNTSVLQIGDWVKGKLLNGELMIGFVESLNMEKEQVAVTVAVSDNERLTGETIRMPLRKVEPAPIAKARDRAQLLFLIDLALATSDKEWFNELSEELNSLKQPVTK